MKCRHKGKIPKLERLATGLRARLLSFLTAAAYALILLSPLAKSLNALASEAQMVHTGDFTTRTGTLFQSFKQMTQRSPSRAGANKIAEQARVLVKDMETEAKKAAENGDLNQSMNLKSQAQVIKTNLVIPISSIELMTEKLSACRNSQEGEAFGAALLNDHAAAGDCFFNGQFSPIENFSANIQAVANHTKSSSRLSREALESPPPGASEETKREWQSISIKNRKDRWKQFSNDEILSEEKMGLLRDEMAKASRRKLIANYLSIKSNFVEKIPTAPNSNLLRLAEKMHPEKKLFGGMGDVNLSRRLKAPKQMAEDLILMEQIKQIARSQPTSDSERAKNLEAMVTHARKTFQKIKAPADEVRRLSPVRKAESDMLFSWAKLKDKKRPAIWPVKPDSPADTPTFAPNPHAYVLNPGIHESSDALPFQLPPSAQETEDQKAALFRHLAFQRYGFYRFTFDRRPELVDSEAVDIKIQETYAKTHGQERAKLISERLVAEFDRALIEKGLVKKTLDGEFETLDKDPDPEILMEASRMALASIRFPNEENVSAFGVVGYDLGKAKRERDQLKAELAQTNPLAWSPELNRFLDNGLSHNEAKKHLSDERLEELLSWFFSETEKQIAYLNKFENEEDPKKGLKAALKHNPFVIPEILKNHPELLSTVCALMDEISKDDETKNWWNSAEFWAWVGIGSLFVAALVLSGGTAAVLMGAAKVGSAILATGGALRHGSLFFETQSEIGPASRTLRATGIGSAKEINALNWERNVEASLTILNAVAATGPIANGAVKLHPAVVKNGGYFSVSGAKTALAPLKMPAFWTGATLGVGYGTQSILDHQGKKKSKKELDEHIKSEWLFHDIANRLKEGDISSEKARNEAVLLHHAANDYQTFMTDHWFSETAPETREINKARTLSYPMFQHILQYEQGELSDREFKDRTDRLIHLNQIKTYLQYQIPFWSQTKEGPNPFIKIVATDVTDKDFLNHLNSLQEKGAVYSQEEKSFYEDAFRFYRDFDNRLHAKDSEWGKYLSPTEYQYKIKEALHWYFTEKEQTEAGIQQQASLGQGLN